MIAHLKTTYFTFSELKCPSSNVVKLATGFAEALLSLRLAYDEPMHVNSCCRSKIHNESLTNASKNSFHIYDREGIDNIDGTCAIDIHMVDSIQRAKLIRIALNKNWCVGINKTFIHLDRRMDWISHAVPLVFLY